MTLRVVFRRPARQEFEEATLWYEAHRAGLGAEYRAEVERAILMAVEQPLRFPRMHGEIRCVRVRRFPYSLFFLVTDDKRMMSPNYTLERTRMDKVEGALGRAFASHAQPRRLMLGQLAAQPER